MFQNKNELNFKSIVCKSCSVFSADICSISAGRISISRSQLDPHPLANDGFTHYTLLVRGADSEGVK